jgi:hypothetical protein
MPTEHRPGRERTTISYPPLPHDAKKYALTIHLSDTHFYSPLCYAEVVSLALLDQSDRGGRATPAYSIWRIHAVLIVPYLPARSTVHQSGHNGRTHLSPGDAMDKPLFYQIRIAGQLDSGWSDWFDGLTVTPQPNGETTITGPVRDQAELSGILNKLFGLNLTVLDIRRIAPPEEAN